jgi:hypothetical protein
MAKKGSKPAAKDSDAEGLRFEGALLDALFPVLDAVAWVQMPDVAQIAQFAGIDNRTAGKVLKNAVTIGVVERVHDSGFTLRVAYPHKATDDQKRAVVREALVKMPLLESVRQFLKLGDKIEDALRKAATVAGIRNFDPAALTPLLKWAQQLDALKPDLIYEDLLDSAEAAKTQRHKTEKDKRVAFLSHSSHDKPVIRQLATDLTAAGITVWLDEQRIKVGDSIPEQIAQGLAASDFFVIALSKQSVASEWVKHELNNALVSAIAQRKVKVLPVKLDDVEVPAVLQDKRYADFSKSYKEGLRELIEAMTGQGNGNGKH